MIAMLRGMKSITFESYPNNEVRIGWNDLPVTRKSAGDKSTQRQLDRLGATHDKAVQDDLVNRGLISYRDNNGTLYYGNSRIGYTEAVAPASKLDIISNIQREPQNVSSGKRKGYGEAVRPTSFTRAARHKLLEGGQLFDTLYSDTHQGYFVTFTLPGSTEQAYDAISRWSGYLANRVLQVVRRGVKGAIWFFVWELQRRGALHLHLFLALPRSQSPVHIERRLRDVWYRALQSIGTQDSVDMFLHSEGDRCTASQYWQYDFQSVKKSPAAYISKYVGKGANVPGQGSGVVGENGVYFPHRWWGMCRELSQEIDRARFKVCMDAMTDEQCMDAIDELTAELTELEPVQSTEYVAEVGTDRESGKSVGTVFRRIFWFKAEDFQIVDFLFRKLAIAWMQRVPRHLQRWWYNSLTYKGMSYEQLTA